MEVKFELNKTFRVVVWSNPLKETGTGKILIDYKCPPDTINEPFPSQAVTRVAMRPILRR